MDGRRLVGDCSPVAAIGLPRLGGAIQNVDTGGPEVTHMKRWYLFMRSAQDRVTADVVSRTERFFIPADWTPQDNVVRREMFLCISTNPCPSIAKRWHTGQRLTIDDLKKVSSTAGFAMSTEGTCTRRPNVGGTTTVCSSSGTDRSTTTSSMCPAPTKTTRRTSWSSWSNRTAERPGKIGASFLQPVDKSAGTLRPFGPHPWP